LTAAEPQASDPQNTRLTLGNYIADVLVDSRGREKIYHWIVQKADSAEILEWSQEHSLEDALAAARAHLEYLNRTNEAKNA
jgi:hypothetical protein